MLPELLHAKYRGNNTTYRLKHETRHKSQRQNYDGLHDHVSYNYTFKKMFKERGKFFFRVKYQNVGIFCISKMSKNKDWEVYIKTHITTIKSKRKEKKQYRWQSIDTLVGSLDCSQETSRKRIAGGSNQDTGLYIACCALLTSDDSAKSLTSFQCNKGSINKHKRGSINQLLLGIWRKNQPG